MLYGFTLQNFKLYHQGLNSRAMHHAKHQVTCCNMTSKAWRYNVNVFYCTSILFRGCILPIFERGKKMGFKKNPENRPW